MVTIDDVASRARASAAVAAVTNGRLSTTEEEVRV